MTEELLPFEGLHGISNWPDPPPWRGQTSGAVHCPPGDKAERLRLFAKAIVGSSVAVLGSWVLLRQTGGIEALFVAVTVN